MFNTPILDIVLGLIFIFLLYSLLATSLKEGIATILGLRARMLKKGIVIGMLTATPDYTRWYTVPMTVVKGSLLFLKDAALSLVLVNSNRGRQKDTLGGRFYQHPILKNYGSSGLYPYPSYLPADNFSLILVDTLKRDYLDKIDALVISLAAAPGAPAPNQIKDNLVASADIDKIRTLLQQYRAYHNRQTTIVTDTNCLIDDDTLSILELHLMESQYAMDAFKKQLEAWFNDSMNRVSGWYKRQVQVILFCIGLVMAFAFNADVIDIAAKLSKNNKLGDQLINSAAAYSQARPEDATADQKKDFVEQESNKFRQVDTLMSQNLHDVNGILELGYGNFGATDSAFVNELKDKRWYWGWFHKTETSADFASTRDSVQRFITLVGLFTGGIYTSHQGRLMAFRDSVTDSWFVHFENKNYPFHVRKAYISYSFWGKQKMLGFAILALAVCLGAPFWFDLLSRFVNLRSAGKKE